MLISILTSDILENVIFELTLTSFNVKSHFPSFVSQKNFHDNETLGSYISTIYISRTYLV